MASDGTVKRPIFTYTKSDKIPLLVENKNLIKKKIEERRKQNLKQRRGTIQGDEGKK